MDWLFFDIHTAAAKDKPQEVIPAASLYGLMSKTSLLALALMTTILGTVLTPNLFANS